MPLDSGGLGEIEDGAVGDEPTHAPMDAPMDSPAESYGPDIHSGADVGQALRAIRESKGLTVESLAETTRVRSSYLLAIEEMRLDQLPSRPFVIGYIRAYAQALGVDGDEAVGRFKAEEPVLDEALPEPVGVGSDRDPRLAAIIAGGVVIIAAIVAWNVVQRVTSETAPASPTASDAASAKALANTTAGPVALGAPLPAPVESTTPPPYQTPGLDKAVNADGQLLVQNQPAAASPPVDLNLPKTFTPRGQIYGVTAAQAAVTLQALKPAFLVVHGGDGSIYFARQLNEGEAYRAPNIAGMTVDVSEPDAFQVFSGGQSHGVLPQPLTPVERLVFAPPAPKPAVAAATPTATTTSPAAPKSATPTVAKTGAAAPKTAATTAKPAAPGAKPAASATKPGATTAKSSATTATKLKAKADTTKPKAETAKPKAEAAKPAPTQDDQPPF